MSTKLNRKVILKPDLCKLISSPFTSTFGSTLPLYYTLNVWRCSLKSEYCVMKIQGRHLNHHLHVVIVFANRNHMKIILYHHYINILILPFNNHLVDFKKILHHKIDQSNSNQFAIHFNLDILFNIPNCSFQKLKCDRNN